MKGQIRVSLLIITLVAVVSGCGTPGGRGGPENGGGRGPGQGTCQSPVAQLQTQFAETAQALQLTPKQLVLWEAYQSSVGEMMADQIKHELDAPASRLSMQQIGAKVDVARNHLTAMEDVAGRATALYQSLDSEQKKTADLRLAGTIPVLRYGSSCQGDAGRPSGEDSGPGKGGRGGPGGMGGGGTGRF